MSKIALARGVAPGIAPGIASLALLCAPAFADFAGQPILGPITAGASVAGDVTGAADDNDGFDSGIHIFDIWNGGDDVWALNWAGGGMQVDLIYDNFFCDVDLFVYSPGSLDSTGDYAIANTGIDTVILNNADAGTYYINVDSTFFSEGAYTLNVTAIPTPGSAAVLAVGACAAGWRRRR